MRTFKILANPSVFPSARELKMELQYLFDDLKPKDGYKIFLTSDPTKIKGEFIRYGNSENVCIKDTKYNSAEFIRLTSNKINFSNFLQENDVLTPIFKRSVPEERDFPVIVRESLFWMGGKGIHVVENIDEFINIWKPHYYWAQFINVIFELRVHVLGGNVVKIFKKIRENGREEEKFPIRNLHNGYHFSLRAVEKYPKTIEMLKIFNQKLLEIGGSFYSLDVGWSKERQQYIIFEANSASGLNENTAKDYAEYIFNSFYPGLIPVVENKIEDEGEDNG